MMGVIRFELATAESLDALNDRCERLGYPRMFGLVMSPAEYLLALGGITEASLRDMERKLGLDDARIMG
jgi:hypothetical protein